MLKYFMPDQYVKSIFDIQANTLKEAGIKGVITDLDNTLVAWDRPLATPEINLWLKEMKDQGILVTIISNNNRERVTTFSEPTGVPFIYSARKPMGRAFRKAMGDMRLKPNEIVVIGDQLLTDVFGGNRSGLRTILVVPVSQTDGFFTRINRTFERMILRKLKTKPLDGEE